MQIEILALYQEVLIRNYANNNKSVSERQLFVFLGNSNEFLLHEELTRELR